MAIPGCPEADSLVHCEKSGLQQHYYCLSGKNYAPDVDPADCLLSDIGSQLLQNSSHCYGFSYCAYDYDAGKATVKITCTVKSACPDWEYCSCCFCPGKLWNSLSCGPGSPRGVPDSRIVEVQE